MKPPQEEKGKQTQKEKEKEKFDIEKERIKLNIEQDEILIDKVKSLIDILEATEPIEDEDRNTITDKDKYPYRSILTETNKEIIRVKLFKLIAKY